MMKVNKGKKSSDNRVPNIWRLTTLESVFPLA